MLLAPFLFPEIASAHSGEGEFYASHVTNAAEDCIIPKLASTITSRSRPINSDSIHLDAPS